MRCPKCRKSIAFEAGEHPACGWKFASKVAVKYEEVVEPPESLEVRLKHLAKMRELVKRRPEKADRVERPKVELMRDVGHGDRCTCEICYVTRMNAAMTPTPVLALRAA